MEAVAGGQREDLDQRRRAAPAPAARGRRLPSHGDAERAHQPDLDAVRPGCRLTSPMASHGVSPSVSSLTTGDRAPILDPAHPGPPRTWSARLRSAGGGECSGQPATAGDAELAVDAGEVGLD